MDRLLEPRASCTTASVKPKQSFFTKSDCGDETIEINEVMNT